jgi:uncharacterized phage protein (TIGR01671 family)
MEKRIIKFRGKRIDNGEWVYGYLVCGADGRAFIVPKFKDNRKSPYLPYTYKVIPETVGQFTGLHDKNGKEIWEGDVCDTYSYDYGHQKQVVIFKNGSFCFDYMGWAMSEYKINLTEIIGNIYENPELITPAPSGAE